MKRLHPNRFVLATAILTIWLAPPVLDWLSVEAAARFPESSVHVPVTAREMINVISLVLGAAIIALSAPSAPVASKVEAPRVARRTQAAIIDLGAAQIGIALPAQFILFALSQAQFGGLDLWDAGRLSHPLISAPLPFAWLLYTGWHLARRKQTLGQFVAGYRLVHPAPPSGWQEPLYQTFCVLRYGLIEQWTLRTTLKPHPMDMANSWTNAGPHFPLQEETGGEPRWYRGAGVIVETLQYANRTDAASR